MTGVPSPNYQVQPVNGNAPGGMLVTYQGHQYIPLPVAVTQPGMFILVNGKRYVIRNSCLGAGGVGVRQFWDVMVESPHADQFSSPETVSYCDPHTPILVDALG